MVVTPLAAIKPCNIKEKAVKHTKFDSQSSTAFLMVGVAIQHLIKKPSKINGLSAIKERYLHPKIE